jgi:polyvinyl alcohol dehydrogenase (cytochrome)
MRNTRRWTLTTLLTVCAMVALAAPSSAVAADDWPGYLFGPGHSSYNAAATAITPANAGSLTSYWQWQAAAPTMTGQPSRALYASPTVYQGRVYIGADTGVFYALDLATKKVVWSRFLGFVPKQTCGKRGLISTATVAPDASRGNQLTVYVGGADGYLYALRADTGAIVWRAVVHLKSPTQNDYYNWASPAVAGGHVYMGISSQCDHPLVRGGIIGFSQASGATLGTYYSMAAGHVGGGVWSSVSVSREGDVFATTGTGRLDDAESIVRVNGTTMAREEGWQVPDSDLTINDADFGASPTMFTATVNGTPTEMVGACNKNGIFYALKANDFSSGPVWKFQVANGTPEGSSSCLSSAIWDGHHLFAPASPTTIGGTSFQGAVREIDPSTGAVIWARGLGGIILGSPTMDGAGVIAAATYDKDGTNSVYLINSANGQVLKTFDMAGAKMFAQPVFADGYLFIASLSQGLQVFRP